MIRSIRWRLQFWYAGVLCAVVASFAGVLYYEVRAARMGEVDAQLATAATSLDATLRLFPQHELLENNATRPERPLPKGPAPPSKERLYSELILPTGVSTPGEDYFGIWRADGTPMKMLNLPADATRPWGAPPRPVFENRNGNRELTVLGPQQTVIFVGRPTGKLHSDLSRFAWQIAITALVAIAFGLVGGWIVSKRVLRPIAAIAATAAKISGRNLTERIEAEKVDLELAELAIVLNATFQRLQEAFERQARFTSDASHELRTPLAVLRSHAELSLSRPRTPEEYRKTLETSLNAVDRMTELVEKLLALARGDAGWTGLKPQTVALNRVVEDAAAGFGPLAATRQLKVTVDSHPATVSGDPIALGQVFSNLIANAIQYNRPGGKIRVTILPGPKDVTVTIADTGVGIKAADRVHLFERFFRVDKSRSRAVGGSGLGLAICKSIAEAHGGEIGCDSVPDEGSTFWVRLPRSDDTLEHRPLAAKPKLELK